MKRTTAYGLRAAALGVSSVIVPAALAAPATAQSAAPPERFEGLAFERFFLQPMDGPDREANVAAAVAYCRRRPQWRLSLQTHKLIGLP